MARPILSYVSIVQLSYRKFCTEAKTAKQLDASARPMLLILHAYASLVQHGIPVLVLGGTKDAKESMFLRGRTC